MPEWTRKSLSEVGTLQRGRSRHRPRYAFHLYGGKYPFIQTGEVKAAPKYIRSYEQTYSEAGLAQSKLWDKGTLCITIAANIADVAILDFPACFPDSVLGFIPDPNQSDRDFVFYTLRHFQKELQSHGDGSVQDNINLGTFETVKFPFPPIDEQRAIAEVLSGLDDKIDLLHRQNKTLERLAETLFRQWFILQADPSWKERGLDEIAGFLNGLACQKFPPKSGVAALPVIKIKELRTGITDASDLASSDVPDKYIIADGDILFSWSGSLEVVIWSGGQGVLNQHLFKVTSAEFPQWFYYFWIKHHLEEFRGVAGDKATTMGHIQRHHLSDAKALVPTKNELALMNEAVEPLFSKLKANNLHARELDRMRDALLPKLMSGEVQVRNN